jgi:hypothetical protein
MGLTRNRSRPPPRAVGLETSQRGVWVGTAKITRGRLQGARQMALLDLIGLTARRPTIPPGT